LLCGTKISRPLLSLSAKTVADLIASLTFAITSELVLGDSKLISWVLSEIPILTSVLPEPLPADFVDAM
jgi:hypothetical protein